jgi:tetratricopeptide (TPR) repeat protein
MRLKFSQRNPVGRDGRATGAAKKTLYDFLGVDPGADAQTLRRAFRKTVKEHHPDLHRDDPAASQRTKVLIAAHELLSDPQQRAAYDQYLTQLHEPPPRSEWQRKIIYGASTAVCLSFALVSAWEVSVASTHQVTPVMQGRPYVETAGRDLSRDYDITREAQAATAASSGAASLESHPISVSDNDSRIAESDDLDRVITDLDRAIQRTPANAQDYRDRANAWARKGDMDQALADYEQAIQIDPNDAAIFHDRGLMWQRNGEFNKAIVDFDRAVRMSFADPELYCDRGAAWFGKGRLDRALADFNQALKINPRLATAYVRRAAVFERKGDQERARADREQATRLGDAGKAVTASNVSATKIADSLSKTGVSAHSGSRTIVDQVAAATVVAERVTAATSVAILIARPEIKSVSDLAGKSIAIDRAQSTSSSSIQAAIVKAGAAEVQLTESQTTALDRVIGEEVPAAVLTLASQEAAEGFPEISGFNIFRIPITPGMSLARIRVPQPATDATAASAAAATTVANLRPTGAAPDSSPTVQELVTAATTVAERMTVTLAAPQSSEQKTNRTDRSERSEIGAAEKTTAVRSIDPDPRIAILMVRSAIKSVADLAGKEIAIDEKQSASSGSIRTAVAVAGAAEVQVSEGQGKAINRLILAEVPAAVLAVVSREAAEAFPEIPGFRIFRIPLSRPGSSNEDSPNRSR